jgi:hypothetical protein
MATADRKRKRETNEEENKTMETEQNSSAQFPQINPSQLQVMIELQENRINQFCFRRIKPMVFVKFQYLHIVIHH